MIAYGIKFFSELGLVSAFSVKFTAVRCAQRDSLNKR
jgi:hypothetical protein